MLGVSLDAAETPLSNVQNISLLQTLVAVEARYREPHEAAHPTHRGCQSFAGFYRFTQEATGNLPNAASAT